MKKHYFFFFLFLVFHFSQITPVFAQAPPQGINYQAVARDNSGNPLAMQAVTIRFTVYQSFPTLDSVWIETHSTTTNAFGLFTAVIGQGPKIGGSAPAFSNIKWGGGTFYLRVKVNGFDMGATQFLTVPYAFHAHTADSVKNLPANVSPWTRNLGSIYPTVLSDSVGIGTTTPGVKLDVVNGSIRADAGNNPSVFEALFLKGGSGGDPAQGGEIQMSNTSSGAVTPNKYLRIDQLGNFQILNNAYSSTLFNVMDNGNVGLGTAAPLSALEINGAVATTIKTVTASTTLDNTAEVWYTTTAGITLGLPIASTVKNRRYIIVYKGTVATSISISPAFIPLALTGGTTVGNNTSIEIISDGTNWLQIK